MLKKFLKYSLVLILPLILAGCGIPKISSMRETENPSPTVTAVESNQIKIKNNKIIPTEIVIKAGETVTFENLDKTPHLIISDPHPTHDALIDLYSGELYQHNSYQYMFTKAGIFFFHLEDNPSVRGKITVK